MSEQLDFELKLSAAVKVFATNADASFDPSVVAASAIADRNRGWRIRRPSFDLWRVAAVGAAAVVLVVAGAFGVNLFVNQQGIGGPSPNPTQSPNPSPAPTTELHPGLLETAPPPASPAVEPTVMPSGPGPETTGRTPEPTTEPSEPPHTHATIAGGPGFVAVGAYDALDRQADIWSSPDGRTWTRVPSEQLGAGVVNDVTIGGPGLVAVGKGVASPGYHAAVWTSEDGLTWSRISDGPDFDHASMTAVTAGGPGLVAVGDFKRAWFSSDGLTWSLATVPPVPPDASPGLGGSGPHLFMTDVAASGGRLVALGENWQSERPVVWTSADGLAWTNVPLNPDMFPEGSLLQELTGGPDGFTVTGVDGDGRAATWTSDGGRRWLRDTP